MEGSEADALDEVEFCKEVVELLKKERKLLMEKGLDVDFMIEEIERLLQRTVDAKARLEAVKRELLMIQSESLIGSNGPGPGQTEQLDMASKELRKEGDVEEYFRRLKRRLAESDRSSNDT